MATIDLTLDPTSLADVIVPERFTPYVIEQSTRLNAFFKSGVVQTVPGLNFGSMGGQTLNMPFWKQPTERAQLLDDQTNLSIATVDTGKDVAVQHARAFVFGQTDLSAAFAGDDIMASIGDLVAQQWSNEFDSQLIATLNGAMTALGEESPPLNTLDISGLSGTLAEIDGASFVDACQTLGDNKSKIVAIAVHSAVEADLLKKDLIEFIPDSQGKETLKVFQGKTVIVDDALTAASGGIYTTWLFGEGAIGYGEGQPKKPTEVDRFALIAGGQEFLVSRRHYVLHPRGIKWTPGSGVPAAPTPSDAELANDDNWTRVYDHKNIRLVAFIHKIA